MTRAEIEERIEKLEDARFDLRMKDRWDWSDNERIDNINAELRLLKGELEKC